MLSTKLKAAAGNSADATLYVNDVFSTYLYTGNNTSQNINNGIDLAGKGGMVWQRSRTSAQDNHLWDTARGANYDLVSNSTAAQYNRGGTNGVTSFNSDGFTITGNQGDFNASSDTYASWTFRKAAKFFDVVTYTGTGSARTIAHSLGVAPGMIIVKRTDTTSNWQVYSNGLTSAAYSIQLNLFTAQASAPTVWNSTAPTSSVFSVGTDATVNASGGTYVAYLYAHDTSSTGIIQCGSYVCNGTATQSVNLGWEPQYVIYKRADGTSNWQIVDSMRGMAYSPSAEYSRVYANASDAETTNSAASGHPNTTATGFNINGIGVSGYTFIYMAIRMPNKPPTSGTQVFMPQTYAANDTPTRSLTGLSFPPDLGILFDRSRDGLTYTPWADRLRGGKAFVESNNTNSETTGATNGIQSFDQNGITIASQFSWNNSTYVSDGLWYAFKRAPGFFDEVCYTETGVARAQAHNLGVVPELIIQKARSVAGTNWNVSFNFTATTQSLARLNLTNAALINQTYATIGEMTAAPTATNVNLTAAYATNITVVMYLFATLAGISKVGSYTGNGTGQAIACGFSAGARFVLIKRTDSTGNWYTFDSARGLTSGSSPYLLLNSTAAEVTGNNGVYASTGGFTLGSTASTTTNINAATYIFLAVA